MSEITEQQLKNIVEAALLAAGEPLHVERLLTLFDEEGRPEKKSIVAVIESLQADCEGRGVELRELASGYRYQARSEVSHWVSRLWEERAPRYSRALLETLALVAYRQPITRAEIENIRGVASTLQEQNSNSYRKRIKSFLNYHTSPNRRDILKAFANHDRDELLLLTTPFLDLFRKENPHFTTFSWVLPNNKAFYIILSC